MTDPPAAHARSEHDLVRRAGSSMAWGQLGKVFELALTTAIAVIAVRVLRPQGFGTYTLLTYLAGAASIFIPVAGIEALSAVLPRFAARRQRLWLAALVTCLRLAVIGAVALVLAPLWGSVAETFGLGHVPLRVLLLAVGYWAALDLLNSVAGVYLSELELRPVTLWKTVGLSVTLAGLVALGYDGHTSVGPVLVVVGGGYAIAAAGLVTRLRKAGRPERPAAEDVRFVLGFTRTIWPVGIVSFAVATQIGVLLTGALTGSVAQVAFYATAVGVVGRAQILLLSGWSSLMIPSLGAAHRHSGLEGVRRASRLFMELWLVVALPMNALILAVSVPLVRILFGETYASAGGLVAWFSAASVAVALAGGPIGVSALWALDRQGLLLRVRVVVGAASVALAVVLIDRYAALGAVISAGAAALMTALAEYWLAWRAHAVSYPFGVAARVAGAAGAAGVLAAVVSRGGTATLVLGVALGTAVYFVLLWVLKPFGPEHVELAGRISPRLTRPLSLFARPAPVAGLH